jgi:hypothetical protein
MIRNYETPEGTIALIDSIAVTSPVKVFTSSITGGPISGPVTGRTNAVTTIAFCNTAAPNISDETANAVNVNVYIVRATRAGDSVAPSAGAGNLIVSNLTVPAGETVFFSEERVVLDSGDSIWVGTSAAGRLSVTVSALAV